VLEQLWTRPAVEVISLASGDPVGPTRGAVPSMATVGLSFRTVPGQKAAAVADQLRQWVAERLDGRVDYDLTVSEKIAQDAYETPGDLPALAALSAAMADGFGKPPGRMGNAGGGPAELLSRKLSAPVLFFGIGLPEDRWHDSDERVAVDMLVAGAVSLAHFWPRLADLDHPAGAEVAQ
jgi:acetylornithine deacetylase/succinyl-diaminopimelate desuccinylase-like protein